MRRMLLVAVCFVMLGVSLVIGTGSASADGGGSVTTQSTSQWCRGC